jgi:hypothetical protein
MSNPKSGAHQSEEKKNSTRSVNLLRWQVNLEKYAKSKQEDEDEVISILT